APALGLRAGGDGVCIVSQTNSQKETSMKSFPRRLWNKSHRQTPAKRTTYRPRLEVLEGRLAPALLTVNTTDDKIDHTDSFLTLREAINVVNDPSSYSSLSGDEKHQINLSSPLGTNDTIQFHSSLNGQTITLGLLDLPIIKNLNIRGPGADNLTIDAQQNSRV